jgi:hypothetical protein
MDFFVQIVTFILGSYLAFSNTLAGQIEMLLPEAMRTTHELDFEAEPETTENTFRTLTSQYGNGNPIPDILIKNAAYQKASIIEGIDPDAAPATALEALVNIFCTYKTDTYIKTTTGTGFFIDTDGIILTNAHVAQFLLLEGLEGETNCVVRTGNPATPMYEVDLLYIPPAWVREHAKLINDTTPKGTGERDYALLYATSGLEGTPMPAQFKALPFDTDALHLAIQDTEVFATGYPAGNLFADGFDAPLIPKQATTTIGELMTFGSNLVDVFTIRGTSLGEHGSSGGPIVDKNGFVIGIISTKGDDEEFGVGSLRAISLAYINRTIQEETGFSLVQNLNGNLPYRAQIFKETIVPFLQESLKSSF